MDKPTIVIISDYGTGDAAFTEVMLQLRNLLPNAELLPQSTPPFSTLNTGFWIAQVALTPNLKNTYIYSNTAPRKEDITAQANNKGERLMYAKLKNGFEIIGVNAGYNFSFVKQYIEEFTIVNVENEGSQFRSRDFYPKAVAKMLKNDYSFKGENASTSFIPDYPPNVIASVDGYGNIKTTTRFSQVQHFKPGERIMVTINSQTYMGTYTDGMFAIQHGGVAFTPGSSGYDDKFMELIYRGHSAHKLFGKPTVETIFEVKPTE